jgi:phosphoserine phosphatase
VARKVRQNTIAVIYDFDGTLTPYSMQDYTVLAELGINRVSDFWKRVNKESRLNGEEKDIAWMRRIKELAEQQPHKVKLTASFFSKKAAGIKYFQGVDGFFSKVNAYVRRKSKGRMQVRHYIISSGLKEILEGISIRKHFHNVFASEYHYDESGLPDFPKVVVTDTAKTQYIFRINKGKEKLWESINSHMDDDQRPIPFKNIVYIGDGLTDVPAMNVTKKNDGYSVAVYAPGNQKGKRTCWELLEAERVNFIAPADYRAGKKLSSVIELILDTIIQRHIFESSR